MEVDEGPAAAHPPTLGLILTMPLTTVESILSGVELTTLTEGVRSKLNTAFADVSTNLQNLSDLRQKDKNDYDQHIQDLDKQVRQKSEENMTLIKNLAEERKSAEEYLQKYRDSLTVSTRLEEEKGLMGTELNALKSSHEMITRERDELSTLIEKRNVELVKLSNDLNQLSDQLQSTTVAKMEALNKIDDLVSKEIELGYKTKQFDSEREWLSGQIKLLNEELDKKSVEILSAQRESSCKYLHLQTDLSEKIEELRIAEMTLANLRKANAEQEKHVESLMKKLQDSQEIEGKMEENYRQELRAQRKVAELYRESSEESSKKLEELEDAVSNLQDLLKSGTDRYGELETRFHSSSKQFQDEISSRDEEISKLKAELVQANEILDSIQKHGMTDEMINSLSPAAAAASSLLKGSKSITEIFSKYQEVWQELTSVKCENMKLNGYIREILQDIENRAPMLKKQKEDHDRSLETVSIMSSQLDLTMEENSRSKTEIQSLKKNLGVLERENERLKGQLGDLARQVKCLLQEVERGGGSVVPDIDDMQGDAQSVISRTLVTFRNVDELQQQNVRLLAVVRELSEAREKNDRDAQEKSVKEIRDSFAEARKELEDLRTLRMRQEDQLKSVIEQRDTFSNLLKQRQSQPTTMRETAEIESKFNSLSTEHKKLKEEHDMYKTEKRENDRIMTEQMDKLRDEIMKMRGMNAKLVSQVEYNNERAKVYSQNLESYKKTIAVVEERNKQYVLTCLKHEQSIETLKTELSQANSKLARVEVNLASIIEERNGLIGVKSQLMGEKEILLREKSGQQSMKESLDAIRKSLEVSGENVKVKLESELGAIKSENSVLRRKIDSETDRFREARERWDGKENEYKIRVDSMEKDLNEAKNKYEDCKALVDKLRGEVECFQQEIKRLQEEKEKMQDVDRLNEDESGRRTTEEEERSALDNKLEIIGLQSEVATLQGQLELARHNVLEYKNLSTALEHQVSMANDANRNMKTEIDERLGCKDDIIRSIQAKLDEVEKEFVSYKIERDGYVEELRVKFESASSQCVELKRELESFGIKMETKESELLKIRQDLEEGNSVIIELREKYESELRNHTEDSALIVTIKEENVKLKEELEKLNKDREREQEGVESERTDWRKKEESLVGEVRVLKSELEELRGLNASLQDQVVSLAQQLGGDGQEGQDAEDGSGIDAASRSSSEQWLQLIRYLRREKELSKSKMEMAQASSERFESQLKQMEVQYEEVKRQLNEVNQSSHVSIITSAKQAELLRKVETLSAILDSNRILREEKDSALADLASTETKLQSALSSLSPLETRLSELESSNESLSSENEILKQDIGRWRSRATALIEKTNKVNPEEMKRLQNDNEAILKQCQLAQETVKKQNVELSRLNQHHKMIQNQLTALQASNQTLQGERNKLSEDWKKVNEESIKSKKMADDAAADSNAAKNDRASMEQELNRLRTEAEKVEQTVEDHRNTVKQVKNIARKYKKQYEDLLKVTETSSAQLPVIDETSGKLLEEKTEECENLKKEIESLKVTSGQNDERSKLAMKNLREKLAQSNQLKIEVETEVNDLKKKVADLQIAVDEGATRFTALKSQYELKLRQQQSEPKKEDSTSQLQQENENLSRELEMLRQRQSLLEKQFKVGKKITTTEDIPPQGGSVIAQAVQQVQQVQVQQQVANNNAPCTSSSIIRPPLTASIRPMSQDNKQKALMKSVVSVQAMVNQMQSQQSSSSSQQGSQPVIQVQPFVGVAPVSQAQVSTSTPDYSQFGNTSSSSGSGSSSSSNRPSSLVQPSSVDSSSVVPLDNVAVVQQVSTIREDDVQLVQQGQGQQQSGATQSIDNSVVMDLVSSSESQAPQQLPAEVPSCSSMGNTTSSNNKRTRAGQRIDQLQQQADEDEDHHHEEVETSLTDDDSSQQIKKRRTEDEQLADDDDDEEEGQNEAEALGQQDDDDDGGNEADQLKHVPMRVIQPADDDDDVIVIGSDPEEDEEEEEEEEDEDEVEEVDDDQDVLDDEQRGHEDDEHSNEDEEGMLVEDDEDDEEQGNREADSLEQQPDDDVEEQQQQQQEDNQRQENPDTSVRMIHNPRPVTLPGSSSSNIGSNRRNYSDELMEDEGIVPSTPTLFIPRRSNDGFAEAINSPIPSVPSSSVHHQQSSSSSRFTFTPNPPSTPSAASTAVIDETRVVVSGDYLMVDDNSTGRSVPSTPMMVLSPQGGGQQQSQQETPDEEEQRGERVTGEQQPTSSSAQQQQIQQEEEQQQELEEGEEHDDEELEYDGTEEVPTSSDQNSQQQQQQQHRVRPTPIVWDQPTSSTGAVARQVQRGIGTRGMSRGGIIHGGLTRGLPSAHRGGGTYNRQLINQPNPYYTNPATIPPPTSSTSRGLQQSARRSRPHYYPTGSPRGGTSPPSTTSNTRGAPGSSSARGNFTKPY